MSTIFTHPIASHRTTPQPPLFSCPRDALLTPSPRVGLQTNLPFSCPRNSLPTPLASRRTMNPPQPLLFRVYETHNPHNTSHPTTPQPFPLSCPPDPLRIPSPNLQLLPHPTFPSFVSTRLFTHPFASSLTSYPPNLSLFRVYETLYPPNPSPPTIPQPSLFHLHETLHSPVRLVSN